jgi:hypothetical protein
MARPKADDELDNLLKQQAALNERIKAAEQKKKERDREVQQQREQLVGRVVLAAIDKEPGSQQSRALIAFLNAALTKPADRRLVDFLDAGPGTAAAE